MIMDAEEKTKHASPQDPVVDAGEVDAALAFLGTAGAGEEAGAVVEVDEKALVRKIDWRIVPLMCK